MQFLLTIAPALLLAPLLAVITSAIPFPFDDPKKGFTPLNIRSADVAAQLGSRLSENATIYFQNDPRFANATARWSVYGAPNIAVVVEPGIETDVATIVRFATRYDLPFLAVNKGHGFTSTLGRLRHGIEIRIRTLNKIRIAEDGQSVFMQGGVLTDEVVSTLWDAGYVTNTGSCGCVGYVGPGLGGGYGRYMGFSGLISDNFISLNMVLADGSSVVVSPSSNADLWWAMQGAGHNFGIVTSVHSKIYKRTTDSWFFASYVYSGNELEKLFDIANSISKNGLQPKELTYYMYFTRIPDVSPTEPVININLFWIGPPSSASPVLAPFNALPVLSVTNNSLPLPEISAATGLGSNGPACQTGANHLSFPNGLIEFNKTAGRQTFNLYRDITASVSELNASSINFEGYAVQGMRRVDPGSTAFGHREENVLLDVTMSYPATKMRNKTFDDEAIRYGKQLLQLLQEGQPGRKRTAYVNYAFGDETVEEVYGDGGAEDDVESLRVRRLRELKKKYDPKGKFVWYEPLPVG